MLNQGQYQLIDIDELTLDINNPRIKKWIEYYDNPNAANIKLALGVATGDEQSENGTTFLSLRESIRASEGINHPIIVNDDGNTKTVIEGNTRLAIYQEFKDSNTPGNWSKIPAIVYQCLSEEHQDAVRLQSHLVGPRAWDPYSKAKYLDYLYNEEHMTIDRIYAYCGGKQRDIQNYIDAYKDMETHYRPVLDSDNDFDTTRFSGFVELQRTQVKQAIIKSGHTLKDFSVWIRDKKIDPLSTVRQLPKILGNETSRDIFLKQGARDALKVLDSPNVDRVLSELNLADLCRALARTIDNLQYQKFSSMKDDPDDPDRSALFDLEGSYLKLVDDLKAD